MRFLLLLSALLSAMVGSGAYARPTCAQTHQVDGRGGVQAPKVAEAAQARRPVTGLPRIVDVLSEATGFGLADRIAGFSSDTPIYAMRLRV
jgi:trans-2-enoyl-CoA reductase